jgi:hypothetical protein
MCLFSPAETHLFTQTLRPAGLVRIPIPKQLKLTRWVFFLYRSLTCIVMCAIFGLPLLACQIWRGTFNDVDLSLSMLVDSCFHDDEASLHKLGDPT